MFKHTFYMPWKDTLGNHGGLEDIQVSAASQYKNFDFQGEILKWRGKPHFAILNANGTLKLFLDAVLNNSLDEANRYLSKYIADVDICELKHFFHDGGKYKYLINFYFDKEENKFLNSVSVASGTNREIMHFDMIKEPDKFGKWKIYKIEKDQ